MFKKDRPDLFHFAFQDFRISPTVGQTLEFVNNKGRCHMGASPSGLFFFALRAYDGHSAVSLLRNAAHQPLKLHSDARRLLPRLPAVHRVVAAEVTAAARQSKHR